MVSRRVQALLDQLRAQGIQDEQVLNALAAVPREKFVDEAFEQKAWDNIALPIGQGQTISQPYMVARMTELLELTPQSRVLEIGTGSGYQTAILAHLVQHVCSVERSKGLQWHCLLYTSCSQRKCLFQLPLRQSLKLNRLNFNFRLVFHSIFGFGQIR